MRLLKLLFKEKYHHPIITVDKKRQTLLDEKFKSRFHLKGIKTNAHYSVKENIITLFPISFSDSHGFSHFEHFNNVLSHEVLHSVLYQKVGTLEGKQLDNIDGYFPHKLV